MPWIQHFSRQDIIEGTHYDPRNDTVLIQIRGGDSDEDFPVPKYQFVETFRFEFEDIEGITDPNCISDEQAVMLVDVLRAALENNLNVIVHCYAGLCRSSAVAIVGKDMGFDLDDKTRLPNQLVMHKMFLAANMPDRSTLVKTIFLNKWLGYDDEMSAG